MTPAIFLSNCSLSPRTFSGSQRGRAHAQRGNPSPGRRLRVWARDRCPDDRDFLRTAHCPRAYFRGPRAAGPMPNGTLLAQSDPSRRNALAAEPRSGLANGHRVARPRIGFRPVEADRALPRPAGREKFAMADSSQPVEISTRTASAESLNATYPERCVPTCLPSVRRMDFSRRLALLCSGVDSADERRYVRPGKSAYRLSKPTRAVGGCRAACRKEGRDFRHREAAPSPGSETSSEP